MFPNAPLRITLTSVTQVYRKTPRQKSVTGTLRTRVKVFTQLVLRHALGPYEYVAFQPPSAGVSPVKSYMCVYAYMTDRTGKRMHGRARK